MPMKPNRTVVAGAYAVALLLVLMPLSEIAVRIWPLRFTDHSWRFGAVGMLSHALLTPLLGLTLAGILAFILGHRRTVRTLAVVLMATALLLTGVMPMFMLDALQMRASVVPGARLAFDVASAQALAMIGMVAVVSLVLAVGGWRARPHRRRRIVEREAGRRPRDVSPDALQPAGSRPLEEEA